MRCAFFLLVATAAAQNQTGGVTGVVVDSVSHQPVKKAMVSLNHIGPQGFQAQSQGPAMMITDATGSFAFESVATGQAQILVQHANYPPSRSGKAIEIKPGEITGPVTVELIPGAVITGHVLDEDGDPLIGCSVNPHPAAHADQHVAGQNRNTSDINGEYRIFGIPPGNYILSIQCQQPVFEPRPFSAGPDPPPTRAYPMEYYPSATEPKSAELIDLAPGVERSGVDFQMKPAPVTQVRGSFGGDVWRGHQNLALTLMQSDGEPVSFGSRMDASKGSFEFPKVFPGSYLLIGFSNDGGLENRIGAVTRLEVKDQPVETIVEWRRSIDISGTVEIENHGDQTISPNQISIQLTPQYYWPVAPPSQAQVQDDGSFTIKSVLPAQWRIQAQGPGVFVKSAWVGADEITDRPLDVTGGASGPLKIVVSNNTATIRGAGPPGHIIFAQRVGEMPIGGGSQGTQVESKRAICTERSGAREISGGVDLSVGAKFRRGS